MKTVFKQFTTKEISPNGWLARQLEIQANGLSGNLDKMWPDVRDSKWVGGDKEGWERVPYWLDGFIPLAYLLKNEDMIARAKRYIDAIIDGQEDDGWICPCDKEERNSYDIWALFLILKVLIVYYDCSDDQRIEEVVYRALKNFYYLNQSKGMFGWGHSRWFECVISINWLRERRDEPWLVELAQTMEAQGMDYLKNKKALRNKAEKWSFYTHVVNLAMALKSDAVMMPIDGRSPENYAKKLLKILQKHHGNVNGYFNGDECLAGTSPTAGTELCGVAEAMYSYEIIAAASGNVYWMDLCERLAFNSFPATVSEDMWTHQYDQLTNQPYCVNYGDGKHFGTNSSESHLFGLEPNYGCCTANFNQAFPKFVLSSYMRSCGGIAVTSLVPSKLNTEINGVKISVETVTDYPFGNKAEIRVKTEKPIEFDVDIRIPTFVDGAIVNGENAECGKYFKIKKVWRNDSISVEFKTEPHFVKRGKLNAVVCGALTYCVPIKARWEKSEFERNGVERKFPYCDYQLYADSEWQLGFASGNLKYEQNGIVDCAFSEKNPPCSIVATVQKIDWGFDKDAKYISAAFPRSVKGEGEPFEIKLAPYGCSKLRMTELPFVKNN